MRILVKATLQTYGLHGTEIYYTYITDSRNSTTCLPKRSLYCTELGFRAEITRPLLCRNMVVDCSLRKERSRKLYLRVAPLYYFRRTDKANGKLSARIDPVNQKIVMKFVIVLKSFPSPRCVTCYIFKHLMTLLKKKTYMSFSLALSSK